MIHRRITRNTHRETTAERGARAFKKPFFTEAGIYSTFSPLFCSVPLAHSQCGGMHAKRLILPHILPQFSLLQACIIHIPGQILFFEMIAGPFDSR